jgi:hypothetical protein
VGADADAGCPRSAVAVLDVSALRAQLHHSPSCSSMGAEARHGRSLRPLVNPREPHLGDHRDAGACLLCCRNAAAMTYALPGCLPILTYSLTRKYARALTFTICGRQPHTAPGRAAVSRQSSLGPSSASASIWRQRAVTSST